MNRKLELLYRETEWLNAVTGVVTGDWSRYPQSQLNEGWKIILRNQFHDIIPGSSIREVYEDSRQEYEKAEEIARTSWDQSVGGLVSLKEEEFSYTIMNATPWSRSDLLTVPARKGMEDGTWRDADGSELQAERTDENWLVAVKGLPSMGVASIQFTATDTKKAQSLPFEVDASRVATPFYKIAWDDQVLLVEIYDRKAERNVLARDGKGNVLQVFEDKPMSFDAWDIDIYYQEKMRKVEDLKSAKVAEVNSLRAVVQFEWNYMDSVIRQNMILYANRPRIDFVTNVDWHEQHQLLKVAFPVDIRATEATYDIQYGNVKRPAHWNTSWDMARFETVGHQWADLSEQGYGVSLLNDCKYGYDIKDSVMRLSLIKSATHPDFEQDQGTHLFTYSLLPHQGDWVEGNTVQEAWELNNPLTHKEGKSKYSEISLFTLSQDHVMIDAVKKSEDGAQVVVRVHEFAGSRGAVEIKSDLKITSWQECDLMERNRENEQKSDSIRFHIKPYEIKTFLVNVNT
jgi:alpha-mannosidase